MKTIEEARTAALTAEQEAREGRAFWQFFREHTELSCTANESLLREFHHGEEVTLESLNESLPFLKARLAVKSDERVVKDAAKAQQEAATQAAQRRAELITAIVSLMPGDKFLAQRLGYKTTSQLEQKLAEVQDAKRLRAGDVDELHAEVRRRAISASTISAVELPAEHTRISILAMDRNELRLLMKKYGDRLVTERLNQGE